MWETAMQTGFQNRVKNKRSHGEDIGQNQAQLK